MKLSKIYILLILLLTSCAEQTPKETEDEQVLVSVDRANLTLSQLKESMPQNISPKDSAEYATLYTNRWINHQLKLREAESIFSDTEQEIEEMVAAYRQSLLTKKLDQYYISQSQQADLSHEEIEAYYNKNTSHFRLDKTIVKGLILRKPIDESETKKIVAMMKSTSSSSQQNFISICEKRNDFLLEEFTHSWVDYNNFVALLPTTRDNSEQYLTRRGVQILSDNIHTYVFEIKEYRRSGDISPFELVEPTIRKILTNDFHTELIRSEEQRLREQGENENLIKYYDIK